MNTIKLMNGIEVEVINEFSDGARLIVLMPEKVYVMVDRLSAKGATPPVYDLSARPAYPGEELETLNKLVEGINETVVTVTAPDGTTTTHRDP